MVFMKTVSSLDKVFADEAPVYPESQGSMFRNERFHFQLCIYNDGLALYPCKIGVSGDLSEFVTLRAVEHIAGQYTRNYAADDYIISKACAARTYPDLLRPFEEGDLLLRSGQWTSVWCTVHAPQGLPAGEHTLAFELQTGKDDVKPVEYRLRVLDEFLPESDLIYTDWVHYDCIAEWYGEEPFSERYYKILGTFLKTAVLHGMNMLYTPLFTPPLDTAVGRERMDVQLVTVCRKNGEYTFDFSKLDKFIDFARALGIKYFEMSHLATQWGAKFCPKIMAHTERGYERIFGWDTSSLCDEYKKFLTVFLGELDRYLAKKGIKEKCYFHISDEPGKEQYEYFKKVHDFVRPLIADYKIIDATGDVQNRLADIPVLATSSVGEKEISDGWVYYCNGEGANYLSNRFFNMPSQRTRILGMQLYRMNASGFLHWGFNFYNSGLSYRAVDPFAVTDAGGAFQSGDSFSVYPGADGAWDSLRLEVLYDGFQDRMALKLLERKIGREKTVELLAREGLKGYVEYPRSAEWHVDFRRRINEMIVRH